jgi:gliding motility associated protien GldN
MKRIKTIILSYILISVAGITSLSAQIQATTPATAPGSFPEVSFQNSKIAYNQELRGDDILWKREVYRIVDLTDGANGSLYYPIEPTPNRMNLFCTIFNLIANGKISAYEFKSNSEDFSESSVLKFKDLLKNFDIPFREKTNPQKANTPLYEIDAVDIPSSDVTKFYIKEVYYLEQRSSTVGIRTLALCPVLSKTDDYGKTDPYPMFWIPFSSIKGYLSSIPVWADSTNSVSRMNAYDFFNMHRYKGEIYKVSNLKNQTIYDYCETPEARKAEQIRLEKELTNLDQSLWEPSQRDKLETLAQEKAKAKEARRLTKNSKKKK